MSVVLSKRDLNRIDVLARLESGRLTPGAAAALLRVSERQVYGLMRRFREGGPAAIADRRRGRPPNNRLPDVLRNQAVALVRQHYADFGPTLAAEKLADRHDVRVSRETLRSWMIQAGVWRPRAERKRFHQPRHRREHVGELIQIDGCEHHWFEDRGPPCTLLVFVDDATSRLMALGFVPSESTFAYFEVLRRSLEAHGKPVAFYSDKHSIFRVSKEEAAGGDGMTQFGRALADLNIEILCANSSQAKGRVERAHATLQDRPVKELRLAGISDLDAANAFLPGFMASYNGKFARPPARDLDLHRPLDGMNQLGDILCWRETRRVSRQLVVHYNRMKFTLHPTEVTARLVGQEVEVYDFPEGRLETRWRGLPLTYGVVENKRLGEVLAWIKERQAARPAPLGGWGGATPLEPEVWPDERPCCPFGPGRPVPSKAGTPGPPALRSEGLRTAAPGSVSPSLTDRSTLRKQRHFNLVATASFSFTFRHNVIVRGMNAVAPA